MATMPGQGTEMPTMRALELDEGAAASNYTIIGRSRDGSEIRLEPGEGVMRAIRGEAGVEDERGTAPPDETGDPDFTEAEEDRAVVGADNRVKVADSTAYPFRTVGYVQSVDVNGAYWDCTGTLVAPRLVLTAAHCLYDHNNAAEPWRDDYTFWPGLNGETDVPFPSFEYETVYIFNAYVTKYDGTFDSIWSYNFGLIQLSEPIGESLGWLGYWHWPDLGNFDANLIGYQSDAEAFTLWRSQCAVRAQAIQPLYLEHTCDTVGNSGAPVFLHDGRDDGRFIVAIHIGELGKANWGLRLHEPVVEWIQALSQQ